MKAEPSKTRFSLLRFSVRFLLLVFFLVACVLGWLSWKIQAAKSEIQLARKLNNEGYQVGFGSLIDDRGQWLEPGWNYNWLRNHLFSHVTSLTLWNSDITSLETLQRFEHLTELDLNCPLLTDIEALSKFPKLKTIRLFCCEELKDLRPIAALKQLESLEIISCVGLTNIDAVGECTKLKKLNIDYGPSVQDISFISKLKSLEKLKLSGLPHARVAENTFASASQLRELELSAIPALSDLDGLAGLSSLELVALYELDSINDINGLRNCKQLKELNVQGCSSLKNIDGIRSATGLQKIYLYGTRNYKTSIV